MCLLFQEGWKTHIEKTPLFDKILAYYSPSYQSYLDYRLISRYNSCNTVVLCCNITIGLGNYLHIAAKFTRMTEPG